jgi:hypothetical protein
MLGGLKPDEILKMMARPLRTNIRSRTVLSENSMSAALRPDKLKASSSWIIMHIKKTVSRVQHIFKS